MIIDTGAEASCLSRTAYNRLKEEIGKLQEPTTQYYTADGQKLQMYGETPEITLKWANNTVQNKFLILPRIAQVEGLIGIDILQKLKANIDCSTNTVSLNEHIQAIGEDLKIS